ncbi:MAG: transposase [Anaerolineales bacterium]
MTDLTIALKEQLINTGMDKDTDFLKEGLQILRQMLLVLEVEKEVGAGKRKGSKKRRGCRIGYRPHTWGTGAGEFELSIPKMWNIHRKIHSLETKSAGQDQQVNKQRGYDQ